MWELNVSSWVVLVLRLWLCPHMVTRAGWWEIIETINVLAVKTQCTWLSLHLMSSWVSYYRHLLGCFFHENFRESSGWSFWTEREIGDKQNSWWLSLSYRSQSTVVCNSDLQHLEHKGGGKDLGSEVQLDKHPFSRLPGWLWEPTRTADLKYTVEVVQGS